MTDHFPMLIDGPWLAALAMGWRLPEVVALTPWGPRLVILLWRPADA